MINPAVPGKTFECFWTELSTILLPGKQVGKFYGKAFTISAITTLSVEIDSPDAGGIVELPKDTFRAIYADWRNYRYENLAHTNPQKTLHVISITEHVIQTWVRHEQRIKLIELARADDLRDGVFRVFSYNRHYRILGPSPIGEPVSLREVFPTQAASLLSELELAAAKLFNATATNIESLSVEHPGFGKAAYESVIMRAQIADR